MEQEDRSLKQIVRDNSVEHITKRLLQLLENQDLVEDEAYTRPVREGLQDTPRRVAKFYREFLNPQPFHVTTFNGERYSEMVLSRDIPFYSLCEHHMVPFFGVAHVGYIPNGKIVGLSKLARIVDMYARQLQNQERITDQVADFLEGHLHPKGVGVVIKARHLCQEMRGICKPGIETVTSAMRGAILDDEKVRNEFLTLIKI